jgi:hypothetical protein
MPRPVRLPRPTEFAPGAAGLHRVRRALERAELDFVAAVVADGGIDPWRQRIEGRFRSARDALAGAGVSRVESAALVVALADYAVRDQCWRQVEVDPDPRWVALWRHLARRALPPYRTEPLFLLAWSAWRCGDVATARLALGCARLQEPGHGPSGLLGQLLWTGVDPRLLPRLTGQPPADAARQTAGAGR